MIKAIMIVAMLAVLAIIGCTRDIEVTRVVEQTVIVPATVEVTREVPVEVTRVVEQTVIVPATVEVTREVPVEVTRVVVTPEAEVAEKSQISPEIVAIFDGGIVFKGIDGASGYVLKMYISESHPLPHTVIQYALYPLGLPNTHSILQTGIPNIYLLPIEFDSDDYFALETTISMSNKLNRIIDFPDAIFLDANGDKLSYAIYYGHDAVAIVIIDWVQSENDKRSVDVVTEREVVREREGESDRAIERYTDEDGNVSEVRCPDRYWEGDYPKLVCNGYGGIEHKRKVIE